MRIPFTLGRYLAKHFLIWLSICVACVVGLILLFDFTEHLHNASNKSHITTLILVKMTILNLPHLFLKVFPFLAMFATLITLWKFNRTSELTVMRSAGLSIRQILMPLILTIFAVGLVDLFVFNPITSFMTERYERIKAYQFSGKKKNVLVSSNGLWVRHVYQNRPFVLHLKGVNLKKKVLKNVTLLQYGENNDFEYRLQAKTLHIKDNNQLHLQDVWVIPEKGSPEKKRTLTLENDFDLESIKTYQPDPETIPFWKLPRYIDWLEKSGLRTRNYQLYWHFLVAKLLLLISMVILAGAFSFRPMRQGGTFTMISAGLGIGFVLYITKDVAYALGTVGSLPVGLAAWMPALISFFGGISLLAYVEEG